MSGEAPNPLAALMLSHPDGRTLLPRRQWYRAGALIFSLAARRPLFGHVFVVGTGSGTHALDRAIVSVNLRGHPRHYLSIDGWQTRDEVVSTQAAVGRCSCSILDIQSIDWPAVVKSDFMPDQEDVLRLAAALENDRQAIAYLFAPFRRKNA